MALWFAHSLYGAIIIWLGFRNIKLAHIIQTIQTLPSATVAVFDKLTLPPAPPILSPEIPPDFCINTTDALHIFEQTFSPLPKLREVIKIRRVTDVKHFYYNTSPPTWFETLAPLMLVLLQVLSILSMLYLSLRLLTKVSHFKNNTDVCENCITLVGQVQQTSAAMEKKHMDQIISERRLHRAALSNRKTEHDLAIESEISRHDLLLARTNLKHQCALSIKDKHDQVAQSELRRQLISALRKAEANRTKYENESSNIVIQLKTDLERSEAKNIALENEVKYFQHKTSVLEGELNDCQAKAATNNNTATDKISTSTFQTTNEVPHDTSDATSTNNEQELKDDRGAVEELSHNTQQTDGGDHKIRNTANHEEQGFASVARRRILHLPERIVRGNDSLGIQLPALVKTAGELAPAFASTRNDQSRVFQWNRTQMRTYETQRRRQEEAKNHTVRLKMRWALAVEADQYEHCRVIGCVQDPVTKVETKTYTYEEFIDLVQPRSMPPPNAPAGRVNMPPPGAPRGPAGGGSYRGRR